MPHGTHIANENHLRHRKNTHGATRASKKSEAPFHPALRKPLPRLLDRSAQQRFSSLLFCLLLPVLFAYSVMIFCKSRLPQDRHEKGSALSPFNKNNAMRHIRRIGHKPRFVSTVALEESLQYIFSEIRKLKVAAEENGMELDVQIFRSEADTFSTSIGNVNLINSYDNMSSVVARIRPIGISDSEPSLLINSHVDSAIGAPGANDDVVAVGINMEVLRCIAERPNRNVHLKRPVIFLFNGGEEVVLPAAHSFITQHPWAQKIVAHINMESIGSGDSFHLFRLGPGAVWLAKAYARSVSVPVGTVTGTDVFNSKLIPAETDFRIFDEVGNIPGYDFVLLDNGYIYHTVYDSLDKINEVCVCHGGDMVYELSMELAGPSDAIGNHLDASQKPPDLRNKLYNALHTLSLDLGLVKDRSNPRVTFFDVLHLKTVVYEEGIAAFVNIFVVIVSGIVWIVRLNGMNRKDVFGISRMFLVVAASLFGGAASSTFASLVYTEVLAAKLRWYGNWTTALIIFGPTASFGIASALLFSLPRQLSVHRFDQMLFCISVIFGLVSVLFTFYSIMSSYVPTALLLACCICAFQGSKVHPNIKHIQLMIVHAVLGTKLTAISFSSILPLLGRIKSSVVPHDTIAALVVTVLFFTHGALSSLPILCYYCQHLRKLRAALFMVSVAIAVCLVSVIPKVTGRSSRFTYNTDAPKRISAIHFFSPQQEPPSVLWLASQDAVPMNRHRILSKLTSPEKKAVSISKTPTWGSMRSTPLEAFRPFEVFFQEATVMRTSSLPNLPLPTATVISEHELPYSWNITVHVQAPESHLLTVRLRTGSGSVIRNWSVNSEMSDHEDGVWVKHTGSSDFRFWLILEKSLRTPYKRPNVTVALSSGRLGFSRSPQVLKKLLFEEWETPAVAVSTGLERLL